jgi:hypothetical protein
MQRTDPVLFCSIFSVLLAATIFFVYGCDDGSSGSKVSLGPRTEFFFTGEPQEFIVSEGVTAITVEAFGGGGGDGWNEGAGSATGLGGIGGRVQATFTVAPRDTLHIYVGGAGGTATADSGAGGWNGGGDGTCSAVGSSGGGGGGATDIRRGGRKLEHRILVAAGGGGGSGWCPPSDADDGDGGDAVGTVGGDGEQCESIAVGMGGTQSEGGLGFGVGGSGTSGKGGTPVPPSGELCGSEPDIFKGRAGAGGGSGWFGGGASDGSGGGAGSSWVTPVRSKAITIEGGVRGDGSIIIQEYYQEFF